MASRTAARRRAPARGRTRVPYRWVIFGPVPLAAGAAWDGIARLALPGGETALADTAALALAVLVVPVVALIALTTPGMLLRGLAPAWCRTWWRHHDWRTFFARPMRHPGPPGRKIQVMVRAADKDTCVYCRATAAQVYAAARARQALTGAKKLSQGTLQIDHRRPWSLGGLMAFLNLFLLCPRCNEIKSNYWEFRSGRRTYRPFEHASDVATARAILRRENALRLDVFRYWRAAAALARMS